MAIAPETGEEEVITIYHYAGLPSYPVFSFRDMLDLFSDLFDDYQLPNTQFLKM